MTLQEIQDKASSMGINPVGKSKVGLIQSIQTKEGYIPCFGRKLNSPYCQNCCWAVDCFAYSSVRIFDVI